MINGNAKEFIAGLYYGDERFFTYKGKKYFIQGYYENNKPLLEIYAIVPLGDDFKWRVFSEDKNYPVEKFENAKIFDNKSFWEIENEIEWVDD